MSKTSYKISLALPINVGSDGGFDYFLSVAKTFDDNLINKMNQIRVCHSNHFDLSSKTMHLRMILAKFWKLSRGCLISRMTKATTKSSIVLRTLQLWLQRSRPSPQQQLRQPAVKLAMCNANIRSYHVTSCSHGWSQSNGSCIIPQLQSSWALQ